MEQSMSIVTWAAAIHRGVRRWGLLQQLSKGADLEMLILGGVWAYTDITI